MHPCHRCLTTIHELCLCSRLLGAQHVAAHQEEEDAAEELVGFIQSRLRGLRPCTRTAVGDGAVPPAPTPSPQSNGAVSGDSHAYAGLQRLTLRGDALPELWREAAGWQAEVESSELQDLCSEHVPHLGRLLQSRVLEHLQQEGKALLDLQEAAEKGKEAPVTAWSIFGANVGTGHQQNRRQSCRGLLLPPNTTHEAEKGFWEDSPGCWRSTSGCGAPGRFAAAAGRNRCCCRRPASRTLSPPGRAGSQTSRREGWGCGEQPSCPPSPLLPCGPCLGVAVALELEEQFGDLAEGTGHAQPVPKRAAQGSDQQVALYGLQRLGGRKTHGCVEGQCWGETAAPLGSPSNATLAISL